MAFSKSGREGRWWWWWHSLSYTWGSIAVLEECLLLFLLVLLVCLPDFWGTFQLFLILHAIKVSGSESLKNSSALRLGDATWTSFPHLFPSSHSSPKADKKVWLKKGAKGEGNEKQTLKETNVVVLVVVSCCGTSFVDLEDNFLCNNHFLFFPPPSSPSDLLTFRSSRPHLGRTEGTRPYLVLVPKKFAGSRI